MTRAFTPIDIAGHRAHSRRTMPEGRERFLTVGYVTAIALSLLGLVLSALYLFVFLWLTPRGPLGDQYQLLGQTAQLRLLLLSTAIFVGMSFGFLGFGLFLIQAKGDVDAEVTVSDYKLKFARLSPGLFVILCATAIIIRVGGIRTLVSERSRRECRSSSSSCGPARARLVQIAPAPSAGAFCYPALCVAR